MGVARPPRRSSGRGLDLDLDRARELLGLGAVPRGDADPRVDGDLGTGAPRARGPAPLVCSTESFCPALSGTDFWKLRVTSSPAAVGAGGRGQGGEEGRPSAAREARRETAAGLHHDLTSLTTSSSVRFFSWYMAMRSLRRCVLKRFPSSCVRRSRDGAVEQLQLLPVARHDRRVGVGHARLRQPRELRDRGEVVRLRRLDLLLRVSSPRSGLLAVGRDG